MARYRTLAQRPLTPRRALISTFGLAVLLLLLPVCRATAQSDTRFRAAGANTEVIAQGVAKFDGELISWRLVEDTAQPIGQAAFEERALGFTVSTDGELLLTDDTSDARTVLAPGEAAFTRDRAAESRGSLGDTSIPYLGIELVPASAETNGTGEDVLLAGSTFAGPVGDHEVELIGVKLAQLESAEVQSDHEALVLVTEGQVIIGAGEVVKAGEAAVVNGTVDLLVTEGTARVFVARIGAAVPAPAPIPEVEPTSTNEAFRLSLIVVHTELCPPDVTAEQARDVSAGNPCFGGEAVAEMTVVVTNTETGERRVREVDVDTAEAPILGLEAGNYSVVFFVGSGLGETVGACGGQDQSADLPVVPVIDNSVNLELPAGRHYFCETRTVQTAV